MAVLKNITNDIHIVLELKLIKESPKWVGYTLNVMVHRIGKINTFLKFRENDELYFENFAECEVPALCEGLELFATGNVDSYTFSPLDEKDFLLELKVSADEYRKAEVFTMNLFVEEAMIFDNYAWDVRGLIGLRTEVGKTNITDFAHALRSEYNDLFLSSAHD